MKPGARRSRAKWIATLCALAAIAVGVAGTRQGVLLVRESRAIAALRSKNEGERAAALRELVKLRTPRAVAGILGAMPAEQKGAVLFWGLRDSANQPVHFLLDDSDEDVRNVAAVAVGLSASKDLRLLESLIADLEGPHSSWNLRTAAARAIGIAAAPFEARETFECIRTTAGERKEISPEMTSAMGSAARALLEAAETSSDSLWDSSLQALLAIPKEWSFGDLDLTKGIRAFVCRGLAHEEVSRRLMAIRSMGVAYGRDLESARELVPSLVASADGEDPELTAKALEALAMISRDDSVPLSIRALDHQERGVRDVALTALWTAGSAASRALPALGRFREAEKDIDLAERAATLVRRLESEEGRPPEVQR